MNAKEKCDASIKLVRTKLMSLGFKTHGTRMLRTINRVEQTVHFQKSQYNNKMSYRFCINITLSPFEFNEVVRGEGYGYGQNIRSSRLISSEKHLDYDLWMEFSDQPSTSLNRPSATNTRVQTSEEAIELYEYWGGKDKWFERLAHIQRISERFTFFPDSDYEAPIMEHAELLIFYLERMNNPLAILESDPRSSKMDLEYKRRYRAYYGIGDF